MSKLDLVTGYAARAHLQFDPVRHAVERPEGFRPSRGWVAVCGAKVMTWANRPFSATHQSGCLKCRLVLLREDGRP